VSSDARAYHAAGKVILLGEHAVVYGHAALAGALADGVTVAAKPGRGVMRIPAWDVRLDPAVDDQHPLAQAYAAIRGRLSIVQPAVDLDVTFGLPTGAGLGSSAAWAVAVARALADAHQLTEAPLCDAAMASETVIHGKPSGLDHTVSLAGGFGLFRRGDGFASVRAPAPVRLVIGHTGRARDTKGRVARVAELVAERGAEVRARFCAIEALVERGAQAVRVSDAAALGRAMNENQEHLQELEVSCAEIERMCALALGAGALGAKLTGGGGGGCVIALAPGREHQVARVWRDAGFATFDATVNA
jgi:mevalonate kinase